MSEKSSHWKQYVFSSDDILTFCHQALSAVGEAVGISTSQEFTQGDSKFELFLILDNIRDGGCTVYTAFTIDTAFIARTTHTS